MLDVLKKLRKISLPKTMQLNYRYFGWGGVIHPYILCSKNVKIVNARGTVELAKKKIGIVRIGFGTVETVDGKHMRAIWDNLGKITFKGDAHLSEGAKQIVRGQLDIGSHFIINGNTSIIAAKKIVFW